MMILRFSCPQQVRHAISSAVTTQTRPNFIIHLGVGDRSLSRNSPVSRRRKELCIVTLASKRCYSTLGAHAMFQSIAPSKRDPSVLIAEGDSSD